MIAAQFLSIPIAFLFSNSLFYKRLFFPSLNFGLALTNNIIRDYGLGFRLMLIVISIPGMLSLTIDWRIVWNMFFPKKGKYQWQWLILINWISSSIFALSMTHIMGNDSLFDIKQSLLFNKNENRVAFILAVLSLTYLVGFFAVSLVVDVSKSNSSSTLDLGLTSFVPPAYYLGVVAIAWQYNTSLIDRSILCAIAMIFFAALNLSFKVKHNITNTQPKLEEIPKTVFETSSDPKILEEKIISNNYRLYSMNAIQMRMNSCRQVIYDLSVYCLPMTLMGLYFPFFQLLLSVISFSLVFLIPFYDKLTEFLFLQPSKREDPSTSASRLESYPWSGKCFVNGWFRVFDSSDLSIGMVKNITICDRNLAIFRGQDFQVKVLDAYCPHLGANMAIRGVVEDNCLKCPFHGWTFDGSGACTHIPYQSNIPPQAKTRAYHVCEYYGIILVWIHAQDKTPDYYPPIHEKLERGDMVLGGHRETIVNMHINEFAENSTDFMHFDPLHGKMTFPFTPIVIPGITVNHRPDWKEGKGLESHMSWFFDDADLSLCGIRFPETAASAVITFIGPASVVFFTFETPIGSIILFQMHTPLEPLRLQTSFRWYADAKMPRLLSWYIVGNWIAQWQNDIFIWENKKFALKAILVKGDGPMQKQRRWFKQFYTPAINNNSGGGANKNDGYKKCSSDIEDVEDIVSRN